MVKTPGISIKDLVLDRSVNGGFGLIFEEDVVRHRMNKNRLRSVGGRVLV